jgi:CheY-like chemotaxis protein
MSEGKTILVVEDNDFVRMQIVTFLKSGGYATQEARDGNAAFDLLSEQAIDLALVDVRMEPMGGFEFISFMNDEGLRVPTILVTGDQTNDLLEQANRLGVAATLMKPVQKERLMTTVQRVLERAA